jgi:hypothetical protein
MLRFNNLYPTDNPLSGYKRSMDDIFPLSAQSR